MERGAHVSELAEAQLAKCSNDFTTDFIGNIELHHAHVRRAERGVLFGRHGDAAKAPRPDLTLDVEIVA